eukprot:9478312-Lingulodinium_polyedra.AAC.1
MPIQCRFNAITMPCDANSIPIQCQFNANSMPLPMPIQCNNYAMFACETERVRFRMRTRLVLHANAFGAKPH